MLFFVLILAVCLTQMAADIYAPCIIDIARDLKTSVENVQKSMSCYMFGVALSQLIYGPISEGIGRKKPLIIGLLIMIIGSLICMFSKTIDLLIMGRFIQGCGAGACASLWRSIFRDVFSGEALAKYSSYLVIFIMFIIPSSPLLGSFLQNVFDWRANFIFMSLYSCIALMGIMIGFQETNTTYNISKLKISYVLENYFYLLKNPLFMGVCMSTFLSYGAFFSWFIVGPVLLIEKLNLSPVTFGWFTFIGGGSAYALAGYLNGRFVERFSMSFMMRIGWGIMFLSGLLMGLGYIILGIKLLTVILPIILFYFGSTFIWPNAFAIAFAPFGHIAGYAGALYGFMQICGAGAFAIMLSYLFQINQFILVIIMMASPLSAWIIYEKFCNAR